MKWLIVVGSCVGLLITAFFALRSKISKQDLLKWWQKLTKLRLDHEAERKKQDQELKDMTERTKNATPQDVLNGIRDALEHGIPTQPGSDDHNTGPQRPDNEQ